tara:strand:+ start:1825 stop:3354 length:1530 start_codon:yes stop_codon:yes gene_type:complete
MSTRTTKAFFGTLTSFIQNGISMFAQLVVTPIILIQAGQEVLGGYSIIMQIIGLGILLDFGFSTAFNRYLCQTFNLEDNNKSFTATISSGRLILFAFNSLIALFLVIFSFNIDFFINSTQEISNQSKNALLIMAIWTIARTPLVIYNFSLNATQNMAAINIISIGANIIRLIFAIIFVYLGFGITGLIASNVISEIFLYVTERFYFRNSFKEYNLSWFAYKIDLSNKMVRFGLQYWGVNISVIFLLGSDSIIVGSIYGAAIASVFYTTKMPASLLTTFLFKIVDNASPAFNELMGKSLITELKSAYLRLLKYMMMVVIPSAIGIIFFSNDLISEWVGEGQYAGLLMSISLALFLILQVTNHTNSLVLLAVGDLKLWAILSVISGCINLPISYVFGKYFGMEWVVIGMCISMTPIFIFMFYKSLYELKIDIKSVLKQSLIPAVIACLPLIIFSSLSYKWYQVAGQEGSLMFLFVSMAIFSLIWFFGVWFFGLKNYEKERFLILFKIYKIK